MQVVLFLFVVRMGVVMSNDPETFGPLTPVEAAELEANPFKSDSLFELESTQKWYQRTVQWLIGDDPAKARLESELVLITRCLDLKRRKDTWGIGETVTLTQTFP